MRVLNSVFSSFSGPHPDNIFYRQHKDLTVTNLIGIGGGPDRINDLIHLFRGKNQLNFQFRVEIHIVFSATVHLFMALLPSITFYL